MLDKSNISTNVQLGDPISIGIIRWTDGEGFT